MKILEREALILAYLTACLYIIGYGYYENLAKGLGIAINMVEVNYLSVLTASIISVWVLLLLLVGLIALWEFRSNICRFFNVKVPGDKEYENLKASKKVAWVMVKILVICLVVKIPLMAFKEATDKGTEHAEYYLSVPKEKRAVVTVKEDRGHGKLFFLTTIGNKAICIDAQSRRVVLDNSEIMSFKTQLSQPVKKQAEVKAVSKKQVNL